MKQEASSLILEELQSSPSPWTEGPSINLQSADTDTHRTLQGSSKSLRLSLAAYRPQEHRQSFCTLSPWLCSSVGGCCKLYNINKAISLVTTDWSRLLLLKEAWKISSVMLVTQIIEYKSYRADGTNNKTIFFYLNW